jgi:hypothetical protein
MVPEPIVAHPSIERIEDRTPCRASVLYHESIGMDEESQQLARRARWQAVRLEYAGVMRMWFSQEKEAIFVRGTSTSKETILFPLKEILYRKPFITQRTDIRDFYTQTQYGILPKGSPPDEKGCFCVVMEGFGKSESLQKPLNPSFCNASTYVSKHALFAHAVAIGKGTESMRLQEEFWKGGQCTLQILRQKKKKRR